MELKSETHVTSRRVSTASLSWSSSSVSRAASARDSVWKLKVIPFAITTNHHQLAREGNCHLYNGSPVSSEGSAGEVNGS